MSESVQDQIAELQHAQEDNPDGRLFVHLAEAYRRSGELQRAREVLQQGLEQRPDYLSARIVLARVHDELGEQDEAREAWQEVVHQDEENELALQALAELEYRAGNAGPALDYYRRLEALGVPDDVTYARIAELERAGSRGGAQTKLGRGPGPKRTRADDQPIERMTDQETQVEATVVPTEDAVEAEPVETAAASRQKPSTPRGTSVSKREEAPLPTHTDAVGLSDLLVRLLEFRDSTFHAESSLTRVLALAIGEELELDRVHRDALALAALLSDLGGLAFSAPGNGTGRGGSRDADPRQVAISLQLVQGITLPVGVHEAIRHQHERWDGAGFPDGLRDEEIPYSARVLAVARACARVLTDTSRDPGGVDAALDELQRQAGSRFDPVIVSVLRRVFQHRAEHGLGYGLGGRVILVHSEELRALGLATQLHGHGYVTEMSAETASARSRLRNHTAEALVLGAHVPGSDVARFVREVRSNPAWSGIPVVVIDANDMDLRVELLTAGADVCFPSDVNFKEFKATLDALLRRREDSIATRVI